MTVLTGFHCTGNVWNTVEWPGMGGGGVGGGGEIEILKLFVR